MERPGPPRGVLYLLLFGVALSFGGYHALEGDQAYRLPLLLHRQDPSLFARDPFVRAFDAFNPHAGSLALLDGLSRLVGLGAALFGLFAASFGLMCLGVDQLARAVWPEAPSRIGPVAIGLMLLTKGGNIGTNHLFEPMYLDRQLAYALGWVAWSLVIDVPKHRWWAALPLGAAAWIHPSLGLQMAAAMCATWLIILPFESSRIATVAAISAAGLAVLPGVASMIAQRSALTAGMAPDDLRLWAAYVQSPQHMIPHLWRRDQWLAALCFLAPAVAAAGGFRSAPPARRIVLIALGLIVGGLAISTLAIELLENLRLTLFQPFRMATTARGMALVLLSVHVVRLWDAGDAFHISRVLLIAAGLFDDLTIVVVTLAEVLHYATARFRPEAAGKVWVACLVAGSLYLNAHDPGAGHWRLLGALVVAPVVVRVRGRVAAWNPDFNRRRAVVLGLTLAWVVPLTAFALSRVALRENSTARSFRFRAVPADDAERLAVWCLDRTPRDALFVGPPGLKSFRLWAQRALAFNRAGSPYHAAGLADWSRRFREHVDFDGDSRRFAEAYLQGRYALESRYDRADAQRLADLARLQGADHVVARADLPLDEAGPLERLHAEGRYAVYRVRRPLIASHRPGPDSR